ncbi:tRNA selenocysteine 1-associated protein 1 [Sabethes cyaneus]|uniref:tRNA selenocysteine 1-associated protein 1 n=1 Tax=Sabethes cyaneus TaxID=53552 RepID=UPI00221E2E85|nr:tRNA selenocysteine 1-associated protein 1 [Sabethes cyaneus]XP_053694369.1 tRNA selenocysteine 1-associated protein 1 [Sabethes cyaneus]XP_053694370.1 tRNA selenocysteine 1-associated protein 1 [Sabethes cyaneus]XP_053694371.1 tRNA selenocysteine 1-associated protein 1 [Sabethes cyaneus]
MSYIQCQLWMGSLESYMTENFILAAFRKMGEDPQAVKLMRNKYTGEPAGYCFVSFKTDEAAIDAMHKLNGKPIPGTNPLVRFRLNSATNNQNKALLADREFSVWVGDLSSDVDDYSLYRVFSAKYTSIKTAKVILDSSGFSKGYGFVKFGLEDEQKNALYEMNGFIGLGSKPLKICNAVPKPKSELNEALGNGTGSSTTAASLLGYGTAATDYSQYYDPSSYWQNYSAWQGYYDAAGTTADAYAAYQQMPSAQATVDSSAVYAQQQAVYEHHQHHHHAQIEDEELTLVDHKFTLDIDKLNREVMERDRNLYDALESSKWMPVEQLEIF